MFSQFNQKESGSKNGRGKVNGGIGAEVSQGSDWLLHRHPTRRRIQEDQVTVELVSGGRRCRHCGLGSGVGLTAGGRQLSLSSAAGVVRLVIRSTEDRHWGKQRDYRRQNHENLPYALHSFSL
jgi:hypothetical protein